MHPRLCAAFVLGNFFSRLPTMVEQEVGWELKYKITACSTAQTLQAASSERSHKVGARGRQGKGGPGVSWGGHWPLPASEYGCEPETGWSGLWEKTGHLGTGGRGPTARPWGCRPWRPIWSFPHGPQAGPHLGPPSPLFTARSQDFHVHIPEQLKDKVPSLMTSTFLFKLAPGDTQADSSLGAGPRKGPGLVLSCQRSLVPWQPALGSRNGRGILRTPEPWVKHHIDQQQAAFQGSCSWLQFYSAIMAKPFISCWSKMSIWSNSGKINYFDLI